MVDLPIKDGDFPQLCWFTRGYIPILHPFVNKLSRGTGEVEALSPLLIVNSHEIPVKSH